MDKNKTIIKGGTIEIVVTSKIIGQHIVYMDLEDYTRILNGKNIHLIRSEKNRTLYAVMNVYYNRKSRPRAVHREIMNNPKCEVDHIDENGLNNCKSNLRLANRSQNGANVSLLRNNKSGFKGVSYNKKANKWESYITVNRKRIYGGLYNTPQEAAKWYDEMSVTHFKQFAKNNNIPNTVKPNKSIKTSETTGYRGVYLVKRKHYDVYQASIQIGDGKKHIGFYSTPEEAAIAYNEVAKKVKGEDAYLNKVNEKSPDTIKHRGTTHEESEP